MYVIILEPLIDELIIMTYQGFNCMDGSDLLDDDILKRKLKPIHVRAGLLYTSTDYPGTTPFTMGSTRGYNGACKDCETVGESQVIYESIIEKNKSNENKKKKQKKSSKRTMEEIEEAERIAKEAESSSSSDDDDTNKKKSVMLQHFILVILHF